MLLLALLACGPTTSDSPADSADTDPPGLVDADGDGWLEDDDCDDGDPDRHPGAPEHCNGVDDDCDGEVDEGVETTFYRDRDDDGWGDPDGPLDACEAPDGYVEEPGDCDDTDPEAWPGNEELCDGVDNDCDGEVDEDLEEVDWYADADGDGWGAGPPVQDCEAPPGHVDLSGDCDDGDPAVSPGATEACNAVDDDCSGLVDDGAACPCALERDSGRTYMFCTTGADWSSARSVCQAYGYDLASADTSAEDAWLYATAASYRTGYWWIGGNDIATEGTWEWSDGTTWSYQHWCSGEPNNSHGRECVPTTEEDCLVIAWGAGGCWNDYPCSCSASEGEPYLYICEAP